MNETRLLVFLGKWLKPKDENSQQQFDKELDEIFY